MNGDNWVAPALIFFAGAVAGRVLGVRTLVRGAMAAATLVGVGQVVGQAVMVEAEGPRRIRDDSDRSAGRRKTPQRPGKGRA